MVDINQVAPTLPANPFENVLVTGDAVTAAAYAGLAADPLLGPIASILPAPPKLSGTVGQMTRQLQLPRFPGLPNLPALPGTATAGQENIPAHRTPPAYSPFG